LRDIIKHGKIEENKVKRIIFLVLGFVFLGLAFSGLILPIVPGILFLIVSTYFFARSSKRFHQLLMENKWVGKHLHNYAHGHPLPAGLKILIVVLLLIPAVLLVWYFISRS
jgi:uncharacterized membrane protein YbaN (DUF454 family)